MHRQSDDNKSSSDSLRAAGDAGALEAMISRAARAGKGAAPVEKWNPEFCGDLDMRIAADGNWFYMGTPIGRPALVQLFSSVLRKDEDGRTYLVTPVEKVGIIVEDAHFIAVEMTVTGQGDTQILTFRTNVGDVVEAGEDHPLRFEDEPATGGVKPYLLVRGRLEALLSRALLYQLVDLGETIEMDGVAMFAVRSKGSVFPIMPVEKLEALAAADGE
ncbi:DUF1285 domain-containing protein [Nitratireductor basaltis]|uniref:DUF1285 domain-containing protein n=1 Tax=Nitratireductor basaltis TaxID=472175 RepID=A0A084U927_9HYPH|nr:DUF1285 domain-containing protein [Nitratireductor basaltis]KFB09463.1 hypothetical protein EL18_00479 [Nitratireductor basaltis]